MANTKDWEGSLEGSSSRSVGRCSRNLRPRIGDAAWTVSKMADAPSVPAGTASPIVAGTPPSLSSQHAGWCPRGCRGCRRGGASPDSSDDSFFFLSLSFPQGIPRGPCDIFFCPRDFVSVRKLGMPEMSGMPASKHPSTPLLPPRSVPIFGFRFRRRFSECCGTGRLPRMWVGRDPIRGVTTHRWGTLLSGHRVVPTRIKLDQLERNRENQEILTTMTSQWKSFFDVALNTINEATRHTQNFSSDYAKKKKPEEPEQENEGKKKSKKRKNKNKKTKEERPKNLRVRTARRRRHANRGANWSRSVGRFVFLSSAISFASNGPLWFISSHKTPHLVIPNYARIPLK